EPAFLAWRARLILARGLVGRGGKRLVASTTSACMRGRHLLAWLGQVAEDVASVAVHDQRARRHRNDEVLTAPPVAIGAAAGDPVLGSPVLAVPHRRQAIGASHRADDHTAAIAAIAAVRSSLRDVLLAPEAAAAPAAVPAFHIDRDTIDKHDMKPRNYDV